MNKTLLLGLGGVAAAGVIAGGVYLGTGEFDFLKRSPEDLEKERQETAQKLEDLYFEELKDGERYAFCIGREKITGTYKGSVMGSEEGQVDYSSEDISLFNKEHNRIYILGRTIDYRYNGEGQYVLGPGSGIIKTEEGGRTTEYYKKNSAPLRLDYGSNILFPAPERKEKDWVAVKVKMIGTMMGVTEDRTDDSLGDAKTFCSPISLGNRALSEGYFASPDTVSYNGKCVSADVGTPGVGFSGNYNYSCDFIDYKSAIDLMGDYKTKEEVLRAGDSYVTEGLDVEAETATAGIRGSGGVDSENSDNRPSNEEIRRQLLDLKDEIQADQSPQ